MEIFSPAQARSEAEKRRALDIQKAKSIATTIDDLLKEQAEIERVFEESMEEKRKKAETFMDEQTAKMNAMKHEVEELEERRRRALIPPRIKAEDIHSTEEALWDRKLELDQRETEIEEDSRLLMSKLDDVTTREQDLAKREKRLKVMELGAETQRNQVARDAKKLNQRMEEFAQISQEKETEFAFRQSELDAEDQRLQGKERLLEEREGEIATGWRLLADQRLLLEKGFEELRRSQLKHGSRDKHSDRAHPR